MTMPDENLMGGASGEAGPWSLDILGGFSGRGAEGGMSQRGASAGKIEEFFPLASAGCRGL